MKNTLTGKPVTSWYKPGETYDTVFKSMGSTYEECRAEAVGIYFSVLPEVLKIFGFTEKKKCDDITYVNWLHMALAGVKGLEYYRPDTESWGQAHMHARYVLLQVMLEAGGGFCDVKDITGKDGKPDVLVTLDRSKIKTVGYPAIGKFLVKLQVYKTTADVESAKKMYNKYAAVDGTMLARRAVILERKQPRALKVQAHVFLDKAGKVQLKQYEATPAGMIQSYVDRYDS